MEFLNPLMEAMNWEMTRPGNYSLFHIICLIITFASAIALSLWHRKHPADRQRKVLLITTVIVIIFEIYKQLIFSYRANWEYPWYIFPMQFCSTPMYVGLLAGLTKKGKIHESASAYMVTFSLFAGLAVMLYPNDVFIEVTGVNIQTMICHGSMVFLAIYLMATGYVKIGFMTVLKAVPMFAFFLLVAMGLNEWAFQSGLLENHGFNMFYISPYVTGTLPVYSEIQKIVPYPWNLFIYIAGFTLLAYVMQLLAMLVRLIARSVSKNSKKAVGITE